MGTVGISFGSPTSGEGFDVSNTVSQIVTNLKAVETPWNNQLTTLQAQDTALSSIGSDMNTLSDALNSLTDFAGVLSEKEGSSSNDSVLELTSAATNAVAGSHSITVTSLAQTSSYYSSPVSAADTLTGTLTLQVGSGTAETITLGSSNNTLATLVQTINSGDYGVTANIIQSSSGQQISLVSNTSGASGNIAVSGSLTDASSSSPVTFTEGQAGLDASFTVDGIEETSSSNTVSGVLPGVTFQLLSAAPGASVQVEITNNNSDVASAVSSFVNAYNKVIGDLNTQEGKDASGNPEPLYGSPTTATLQEQLEQALNFSQSSGAITSLTQLGVSVNNDGTLSLNTDTLGSALSSNYQDVTNFFQPSTSFTSFGGNLATVLNNLGNSSATSLLTLAQKENASEESMLNQNISNENSLISTEQTQLTAELNQANQTLQEIPYQINAVNEMYSAITGYSQNGNG